MKRLYHLKAVQFVVIGGLAFIVDFTSFYLLFKVFGISLFLANAAGLVIGFLASFILNRALVFSDKNEPFHHGLLIQICIYVALLVFNAYAGYLVIITLASLGVTTLIGKFVSMVLIAAWNFFIYKKVIFRQRLLGEKGNQCYNKG